MANQEKRTAVDWLVFLSAGFLLPARFQALIISLLWLGGEGSLVTNCRGLLSIHAAEFFDLYCLNLRA